MAANYIDISHNDSDEDIAVVVAGTVTNDIRVTYDDGTSKESVVLALQKAQEWIRLKL